MFDFCLELTESLKQIEVIKQQSTPCSAKSPYQDSTLSPHKQKSRSLFHNSKANGSSPLSLNHHRTIAIISLARLPTTTAGLPSSPSTLLAKLQHYSTLATTILPSTLLSKRPRLFLRHSPLLDILSHHLQSFLRMWNRCKSIFLQLLYLKNFTQYNN